MEEKGKGLKIVSLSNYHSPEIKEYNNRNYVTYGKNNSYFQYLFDCYRGSSTNTACINSISDLIYGKGLASSVSNQRVSDFANVKTTFGEKDLRKAILDYKVTGQFAFQIQYAGGHKKIISATHIPIQTLAPNKELNDDGEITSYFYHPDWSKKRSDAELEEISAFGYSNDGIEILYVKNYNPGLFWFGLPDWFASAQWATVEEEIANYQVNLVQRSFSPTMFVSFNNGRPGSEEEENQIVRSVTDKFTGTSNTGNVIISWSDSKENEATITAIPLSDAPDQYTYVSEEAQRKILLGHRITSPMLLGIAVQNSSLGSNKDEIIVASQYFESSVINGFRRVLVNDAIDPVMQFNNISIPVYFDSINPFGTDDKLDSGTATMMSKEDVFDLDSLGELLDADEWMLIDEHEVDYELNDSFDEQVDEWNYELKETKLASTGTARPNSKSEQDRKIQDTFFITRYVYSGDKTGDREFCKKMLSSQKVYRKEDIDLMSKNPVNPGFGEGGANTYDIFLYKGGPRCHHKWLRQTYMSTLNGIDVNSPLAQKISTNQAQNKYKYRVDNPKEVSMKPNDMPLKGFSPNNPNLPKDAR